MSNVFKSYQETLADKAIDGGIIPFLLFTIFWILGSIVGYILVLFRIPIVGSVDNKEDELDKMVKRMNDMGPSN
mgnify:FL=1